jgi:hypothetical protein
MYAIIHKNQVLVGPKEWNKAFFSHVLQKKGITALIPRSAVEVLPYVIDADTSIHKVVVTQDEFNPMTQYLRGPLFTITEDSVTAHYEVVDTIIELARNNFKQKAAEERYRKEVSGIKVTLQDAEYSVTTQRVDRDVFAVNAMLLGDNETLNFKFSEGFVQLTKSDLLTVSNAIKAHVQSAFTWESNIFAQIDAAETAEQLLAITIVEASQTPTVE